MSPELLLLFVPACFALNMAPGPNNLLSISNASRFGFTVACMAGIGRLLAFICMISIAASGLAIILQASVLAFTIIKVAGALYLLYVAVQLWRLPAAESQNESHTIQTTSIWRLARQEFMVAAGNPKAILIFTAFLPQFVNPAQAAAPQFSVLGLLFLGLEWIAIAVYAGMGAHLGKWLAKPSHKQFFNRSCAIFLGAAGGGLLASESTGHPN